MGAVVWRLAEVLAVIRELDRIPGTFHDEIGLDDLRRHVLLVSVIACVLVAVALIPLFSRPHRTEEWAVVAIVELYCVAGLAVFACRWGTSAGGLALVIGLLAVATGTLWVQPIAWIAYLAPALVLLAGTFSGLLGSLTIAVVISADLLLVQHLGGPTSDDGLRIALVLTWANVLLAWLSSEPLRLALHWSWSHFLRAESEADRAKQHQGELAQLVKSLNVAQDRLEQMNRELERARRAAEAARRLKAEFAAAVSHELRTPLNLIIGFSEMMAANASGYGARPLPPAYQADADTIYRNARHLSSLIDDILELAQIDAARLGLLRERASLAEVTSEAVAAVEPLFQRKGLGLRVDVPSDLPPLLIDRVRVRQVLINLLGNAARFTDAGSVRITARADETEVVVSVVDTGGGIPPEQLTTVFEEFRQLEGPLGRQASGSGLGLAISKRLVELHGGAIWAESWPGQGSAFHFTLPLCDNVASGSLRREWETWARPPTQLASGKRTVVVYGDEAELVRLLQRHLDGYQAVAAGSIDEIKRLHEASSVCALVLTGSASAETWQTLQRTRARLNGLPIAFCPLRGRRDLAKEVGVVEYLVKPILREQLGQVLRRNGRIVRDLLVIDDDPDLVDLVARMVKSVARRTAVRGVYGGREGLAAMRERRPELVLLDLLMPDVDGYDVLKAMREDESLRDVPVVVMTARGRREEQMTADAVGLTKDGGLPVAEAIRILRACLDTLNDPGASTDPALRAVLPA